MDACLDILTQQSSDQKARATFPQDQLLDTILQSFITLLPICRKANVFKSYAGRIRSCLAPLLAPAYSTTHENGPPVKMFARETSGLAQRVHALVPYCVHKDKDDNKDKAEGPASVEWRDHVDILLRHISRTADCVFRAVVENNPQLSFTNAPKSAGASEEELSGEVEDRLGLPAWQGIQAGCQRLLGVLHLLQAYVAAQGPAAYKTPVGSILVMVERILSVHGPSGSTTGKFIGEMQTNATVSKDERDWLYLMLPEIHAAAIDCLSLLISRMQHCSMSFVIDSLEQISWLSEREKGTCDTRVSIYNVTEQIVQLIGPSFTASSAHTLTPILCLACEDLVPQTNHKEKSNAKVNGKPNKSTAGKRAQQDPDSYLPTSQARKSPARAPDKCHKTATRLITTCLRLVPSDKISSKARTEMDRVAILLQDEQMLMASVLNPSAQSFKNNGSLLPFFARAHPSSPFLEALILPRMPYIQVNANSGDEGEVSEDEINETVDSRQGEFHGTTVTPLAGSLDSPRPQPASEVPYNLPTSGRSLFDASRDLFSDSKVAPALESPKRARESDLPELISRSDATIEPSTKRPKLNESTEPRPSGSPIAVMTNEGASGSMIGEEELRTVADPSGSLEKEEDEGTDSDDSFEIPPLVIDSSDDDDDDEEMDEE